MLLGHTPVCAVEIEKYPRDVLLRRQADGLLPWFPVWDDIRTFRGEEWRGKVDIVAGGFPCQDISAAGSGAGIEGERSGLWSEMARVVGEIRPRFVFVENSPMLTSRGLGVVLGDLAEMGYDARWCVLGAHHAGAPHKRDRIWILVYPGRQYAEQRYAAGMDAKAEERPPCTIYDQPGGAGPELAHTKSSGLQRRQREECPGWSEPDGCYPVAYPNDQGLPKRIMPTGNGREAELSRQGKNSSLGCCSWWDIDPADLPDSEINGLQGSDLKRISGEGSKAGIQPQSPGSYSLQTAWTFESELDRMANGLASRMDFAEVAFGGKIPRVATGIDKRVDRLKAIGNGQVPATVVLAWRTLTEGLIE